jgi:hypothetical protein
MLWSPLVDQDVKAAEFAVVVSYAQGRSFEVRGFWRRAGAHCCPELVQRCLSLRKAMNAHARTQASVSRYCRCFAPQRSLAQTHTCGCCCPQAEALGTHPCAGSWNEYWRHPQFPEGTG